MLKELGLSYNKIHAYTNDCMVHWRRSTKETSDSVCEASRYKVVEHPQWWGNRYEETDSVGKNKRIPIKVLRHFPLVPRIRTLFMTSKTTSYMKWHRDDRKDEMYYVIRSTLELGKLLRSKMRLLVPSQGMSDLGLQVMDSNHIELWALNIVHDLLYR